jgi:hypothetical protein
LVEVSAALIFRNGKLPIIQRHADSYLGGLFEFVPHAYPEKTVHLKFFVCRLTGGEPEPLGCAAFKRISAT